MDETVAFTAGVAAADPIGPSVEEMADVKAWENRISAARAFDENARKQYVIDRKYARGDRGQFTVGLPIAVSYIEILKSFLYARDPDLDCEPSDATTPPPAADILRMAREQVLKDPATNQALKMAVSQAIQQAQQAQGQALLGTLLPALMGGEAAPAPAPTPEPQMGPDGQPMPPMGPPSPEQAAAEAERSMLEQLTKQAAERLMAPYKERLSEAKYLGQTLEAVISHMWHQAKLKAAAKRQVGSTLTIGPGWLKVCWQEQSGQDPIIRSEMNDMQDNLARLDALQGDYADCPDPDAKRAEIKQQMATLQSKVEVVIARGLAIDFVAGEDIQVSTAVPCLADYRDAPWISHRSFMAIEDAVVAFPHLTKEQLQQAANYFARKPPDPLVARDAGSFVENVDAKDADSYSQGGAADENTKGSICIYEVWNKTASNIITLVDGMKGYARPPYAPNPGTTRFYAFFLLAPNLVDGERHPQSLIQRSMTLLDDMNRIYSNRSEHRARCIPKVAFDATLYEPLEIKKLQEAARGEMVGLKPTRPGANISESLKEVAYPGIDQALYDDSATRSMLEMTWGIQEALSSTIRTAKTATEAEIQQGGTQARTDYLRDELDEMLSDLAEYTAEVVLQKLERADAVRIAGPWAFWPKVGIEDLRTLVTVKIRAGSSGKPNTTAQQEAWATAMPVIQAAIVQVGQLRGSSPESIADCLEELVAETLQRTGEKIDPSRFLPSAPEAMAPMQPMQQPAPAPAGVLPEVGATTI